jgi:hypothetical protein
MNSKAQFLMVSLLFYFNVYIKCRHLIKKDYKLFSANFILCCKKIREGSPIILTMLFRRLDMFIVKRMRSRRF